MSDRTVLVAGALGLVGRAAVEHFEAQEGTRVIALSRRKPDFATRAEFISLDLTDRAACEATLPRLNSVTHVVYAALYEKPDLIAGWRDPEQMATNLAMLVNLMEPLEAAPELAHVTVMQGAKAYGIHVEPTPVPAKERWPRHDHANFYWLQEDWLRARSRSGAGWSFTVLRPQVVFGHGLGSPMNVIAALGAYAAIEREKGRALTYPGGGRRLHQASDARLLARFMDWAGRTAAAQGETFNLANGDALVWQDVFPRIADVFGMEWDPRPAPRSLEATMPAEEPAWSGLVRGHGLRATTIEKLVGASWAFTDRSLALGEDHPPHQFLSDVKARAAGFHDVLDTEDALEHWLRRMQRDKLLPP